MSLLLGYDQLKKINLKYKGESLYFGDFEKLLFTTFQKMKNNENKKQIFIGTQKELIIVFWVICVAVNEYLENISNEDNSILNDIEHGDKVTKDGQVLIFDKVDGEYIHLIEKGNCITKIPIKNAYKLNKYFGNANRINKVSKNTNIAKAFTAQLINVNENEFRGNIKKSSIFIFENKEYIYDIIHSIEIIFNENKYTLSEIFPFAYYSSEENFEFFTGNKIKQNSIIKFVTNTYTAMDIVREDENINNIIFVGNKTYKNSINSEVRQMEMYDSIKKIVFLDTWEGNFDYTIFDDEYSFYALSKNVILNNVNLYGEDFNKYTSRLQLENNILVSNIVEKKINIYQVNNEQFDNAIYDICTNLKSLFDVSYNNIKILEFIKRSYALCNKMEQIIMQLKKIEAVKNEIEVQMEILKKIADEFPESRSDYIIMQDIVNQFSKIIKLMFISNFKNQFILQKYLNKEQYTLVIKNELELLSAQKYYKQYPSYKINVELMNKFNKYKNCKNVIIPFFVNSENINIIESNQILNLDILVYGREKNRINSLIYKTNQILKYIEKNNQLLDEDSEIEYLDINKYYVQESIELDNDEFIKVESKVKELIDKNMLDIYLNKTSYNQNDSFTSMKVKKFILFKDGNCAFLTTNYKANILDKNKSNIFIKEIEQLQLNDCIIFTLNRIKGEEDIVKVILKMLLEVADFKDKYGEFFKLNRLWKEELKNYMSSNSLTEESICTKFRMNSKIINKVTIANWLNGNIIGPRDSDDIRFVLQIINKKSLIDIADKIIYACQSERKIQIHVRKALAKIIVNSLISDNREEGEIQRLIKNTIDDIRKYAYLGEIAEIKDIDENLSSQYVNKVIEKEV